VGVPKKNHQVFLGTYPGVWTLTASVSWVPNGKLLKTAVAGFYTWQHISTYYRNSVCPDVIPVPDKWCQSTEQHYTNSLTKSCYISLAHPVCGTNCVSNDSLSPFSSWSSTVTSVASMLSVFHFSVNVIPITECAKIMSRQIVSVTLNTGIMHQSGTIAYKHADVIKVAGKLPTKQQLKIWACSMPIKWLPMFQCGAGRSLAPRA